MRPTRLRFLETSSLVGWMGWTQGQPPPPLGPGFGAPPRSGYGKSDLAPPGDPGWVTSWGGCLERCYLTRAGTRSSQGLCLPEAFRGPGLLLPLVHLPLRPEAPGHSWARLMTAASSCPVCVPVESSLCAPADVFPGVALGNQESLPPPLPLLAVRSRGGDRTDSSMAAALGALPFSPCSCLVREALSLSPFYRGKLRLGGAVRLPESHCHHVGSLSPT